MSAPSGASTDSKAGSPNGPLHALSAASAAPQANAQDGSKASRANALLASLREPAVRDLAWLLFSPDLLQPQPPVGVLAQPFGTPQELTATLDWLRALDAEPSALQQELATHRITRLGRYAERLLGWFLQHGPAARLVAAGVPLRRAGVTLGECDFLVESASGERLHWELAVKCYLHAGTGEAAASHPSPDVASADASDRAPATSPGRNCLANYVGPNLKDRFDLKLAHVLEHQLPLSAREAFASTGYPGPWAPQMFIKGWLFYRHGETPPAPEELDPLHERGWWVTRADWPGFAAQHAQAWRVLPRLEWLAPRRDELVSIAVATRELARVSAASASGKGGETGGETGAGKEQEAGAPAPAMADVQTIAAQFTTQHGPFMVAAFENDGEGAWLERSRGFIVPDDWPQQAQAYARR